jgi:hypothetical protein
MVQIEIYVLSFNLGFNLDILKKSNIIMTCVGYCMQVILTKRIMYSKNGKTKNVYLNIIL